MCKTNSLKKVKVTDGMSDDCYIFETDASGTELQEWSNNVATAMYNGDDSYFLSWLSEKHFVKLLYDSEVDNKELLETIKCDIAIDMSEKSHCIRKEEENIS